MTIPDPTADDRRNEPSSDPEHSRESVLGDDRDQRPAEDLAQGDGQEPPD
jgi:hypothetical protein